MRNGGEKTYRINDKVVNKPRCGDGKESNPIALDDQPVGNLGVLHRIALESLRFIHVNPPNQDGESRDDTETKRETPDCPEVVGTETTGKG